VLLTDLVGSTELRTRLGESAAEELRRKHDALLAGAIEANRGRVVKNLGDGLMATFAGASDAVGAAVAIQQAIDRHNRSGPPLEVRIGISAGDVAFEEADCFGTPVIEASRLCAAASGGQILASDLVRGLAGAGSGQEFRPLGTLDLKGLPAAVVSCEVVWEPVAVSSVPLPALLTDLGRIFVGRDAELERLGQLWKEAAAGERRVALLAGEPGVGKTRLAAELAAQIHEEGGSVLAGRCDEDLGVPYQPFVEALRLFVDHAPSDDLLGGLGRYGGELARLLPELNERVPELAPPLSSDPETERYRLFDAVAAWLVAVSADEPLLLVLDDLQWASKPTLLLLRHVVRSPDAKRVLVLGTYRDTELTHDHPLVEVVADLRREGGVERLSMSGLDDLGVAAIVEQAAGQTLDEDGVALARAIYEETEGNPFFVREVLRHLAETGAVERREGGWASRVPVSTLGIPEGVRDVVGRRLSRLSGDTNQAVRVAAVVGAEFEVSVVQAAGGLGEEALLAALEEAASARLVSEVSATRYRFSHALVRATLYDSLTAARKVALHRKVAEAIESLHVGALDDHLPALAHHWARASAPAADTARAVDYATRAGNRALAQLANDEAVAYYRQALELLAVAAGPAEDFRRLEVLISLGEAERRAGKPAFRETLLAASRLARERNDASGLVRAALANNRGTLFASVGAVDHERVAVLEEALRAVGTGDSPERARLLATLGQELTWADRQGRTELSDQALAVARRLGAPATLAEVLLARYYTIVGPDTHHERAANVAELLVLAQDLGDPVIYCRALALGFRVAVECGDVEEADRYLEANERLTEDLHQPTLRWFVAMQRAGRALRRGWIEEAERLVAEAGRAGEAAGQPDAGVMHLWLQFSVRFEQGRLGELVDDLLRHVCEFPGVPGARALAGLAYAELDRLDDARQALEPLAASNFDLPVNTNWLRAVTDIAAACARLGDGEWAATLYGLLAPYPDLFPTANLGTPTGSVAHYLGLLATALERLDEAEAHLASAEATHQRSGAPTWLARTRLEWARMLLTRRQSGDAERARELLHQTLATARELRLANVERRTLELLEQ
jgi:class 3 adenylate cyclase/tetratricopeptide (TPR) repeat protein